jgi:hypothetical protein
MEYLQEAADNGEVIQLTYYGGTRPGEARSVVPTTVYLGLVCCFLSGWCHTHLGESEIQQAKESSHRVVVRCIFMRDLVDASASNSASVVPLKRYFAVVIGLGMLLCA